MLLLTTAGIGLAFALKRMIPHHHQWMTLSYAVAPTFFGSRFILCETGPDQPLNLAAAEAVVGTYLALSVLVGDLVNQGHEDTSASAARIAWVVKQAA